MLNNLGSSVIGGKYRIVSSFNTRLSACEADQPTFSAHAAALGDKLNYN